MGVLLVVVLLACIDLFGLRFADPGTDAWNYLAAGERLNAGHPLYSLSPGDRDVPLAPPYWSVPLLSPPFVAVVWRPLAVFGDASMTVWWLGGFASMATLVAVILIRGNPVAVLALLLLSPALWLTAISGNASAYLVPALALRHPGVVALAAAVKLSPVLLAPSVGLLRTVGWIVALGLASLIFGGVANHLDWLRQVPSSAPSPASISGLTGIPHAVVFVVLAVLALRGWRSAVVAVTFATPVVYFSTLSFLALALLPTTSARGTANPECGGHGRPVAPAIDSSDPVLSSAR